MGGPPSRPGRCTDGPQCHLLQCRHEDREDYAGRQQRSLVRSWSQEGDIRKEGWLVDQAGCVSRRWFHKEARSTGQAPGHGHGSGGQADSAVAGESGVVQARARRVVSIRTPCRLGRRLGGRGGWWQGAGCSAASGGEPELQLLLGQLRRAMVLPLLRRLGAVFGALRACRMLSIAWLVLSPADENPHAAHLQALVSHHPGFRSRVLARGKLTSVAVKNHSLRLGFLCCPHGPCSSEKQKQTKNTGQQDNWLIRGNA